MELEDYYNYIDNHFLHDLRKNFLKKFKHIISKSILDREPKTIETFVFLDKFYTSKRIDEPSRFEIEYRKRIEVVWHYKFIDSFHGETYSEKFTFWVVGYINKTQGSYSPEILDENQLHLKELQEIRLKNIQEQGIKSLATYKDSNEKDAISKFLTTCRTANAPKLKNDYHKVLDIIYTHRDNTYLISDLMTFYPYIFDFTKGKQRHNGKEYFTYFPSFYDQQYYYISSSLTQSTYNYWDKIGAVINHFFPTKLKTTQVFFPKVIENLAERFKSDPNFLWLLDFKENEYKDLNKKRKYIVHYEGLEAKFMKEYSENNMNETGIKKLQTDKSGLIDYFKNLHEKSIIGFERMLKLIENNCK